MPIARWMAFAALTASLSACGGDDGAGVGGEDGPAVPARPAGNVEVERFALSWVTPGGESWPLEVIAPVDAVDGGWPVLVTFHGAASGTSAGALAAVARSGVVVVGPRWVDPAWSIADLDVVDAEDYVDGALFDVAECALSAAQAAAAEHGGDPASTTVEGFSAGVHPAAWVGLGVVRDDPCPDADVIAPQAMVVGDAQWLFEGFAGEWDDAFVDATSRATDTVDRFLNPERWTVPDGFVAYLWSSHGTEVDRSVDDAPDSWLSTRGDVDLAEDLRAVGAFDDGTIGFLDNGLLMELRMRRAGVEVVHQQLGGGHSRTGEAMDQMIRIVWREPPW